MKTKNANQAGLGIKIPKSLDSDLSTDAKYFQRSKEAIIVELLRLHFIFKREERAKVYIHIPLKKLGRPLVSLLLLLSIVEPLKASSHLPIESHVTRLVDSPRRNNTHPPASLPIPRPKNSVASPLAVPKGSQKQLLLTITAYCACKTCCGAKATSLAANGRRPVEGVTVAASRSVELGTHLRIEGMPNDFVVQDRLAKRFDDRVDIFFNSHSAAKQFGIKKMKVTFYAKT